MGIRYYAYAFDKDQTDQALANPRAFIGDDPLADAWGFEPHAAVATVTFEQAVPMRDLLYLDKAWPDLQSLTGPTASGGLTRPAFRMFEGEVTMCDAGWHLWVRALTPDEVVDVADDLAALDDEIALVGPLSGGAGHEDADYALHFLRRARAFVEGLAAEGRGMAYLIG